MFYKDSIKPNLMLPHFTLSKKDSVGKLSTRSAGRQMAALKPSLLAPNMPPPSCTDCNIELGPRADREASEAPSYQVGGRELHDEGGLYNCSPC
mmetsp:Transcript_67651/g.105745  ORF Transcript_67651/g.105745 Transcript_67651/m.105745 type:complete len:94 (-) Transcript_67651:1251-1532(-)